MRVVDLFCGCGGLSLGFERAGFDVLAGYDNWLAAINVYKENFKHPINKIDLLNVKEASRHITAYNPQMIIGGPPCQDFSSAGKRNEDNGRGDLTPAYANIVATVRPEWFLMENVSTITKTKKLVEAKSIFKNAGYGLTQIVLDASLCNVPQKRKRFFLIGKLGEKDGFIFDFIQSKLAKHPMTIRDYLGNRLGVDYYYRHPRSYARRGIFSVDEPSPTIRGVNRPVPNGYIIHPNDPVQAIDGIRPLTTKERSLIQTFPDTFTFLGTKSDIEQMLGNAVPVNLATFVGNSILDYIRNHENRNLDSMQHN